MWNVLGVMLSNPALWIYNVSYSPLSYPVPTHYTDVIISAKTSHITGVSMVCSAVCSGADQRKHQSSATLAFVRGIHRWFPSQRPVTQKMFPFDDVIMPVTHHPSGSSRENVYRSDAQITFELYGRFRQLHVFYSKQNYTELSLTLWTSKLPRNFKIRWVRQ